MSRNKGFSIYKNKNNTYTAQTTIGYDENGKQIRKSITEENQIDAISKILPYVKDKEQSAKGAKLIPIKQHMLFWLMNYVRFTVTSRTFDSKIRNFKKHIVPYFGDYNATSVNTNMVQHFLTDYLAKGYDIDTVKKIKTILYGYFEYCIDENIIETNPVLRVKINSRNQDKNKQPQKLVDKAIPEEYRKRFLEALSTNPFLKALCMTAILSGTRPGELLALKWKDYDEANGILSIERAITVDYKFNDNGDIVSKETIVGATKTAGSVRENPVSQALKNVLQEWKQYRKIQQEVTGVDLTSPNQFVFCTSKGKMRTYDGTRHMFEKFCLQNRLDKSGITFYSFRHTFSNDLFENGENPRVVQLLLGHAKLTTTMIYNTGTKMKNLTDAVNKQDEKYQNNTMPCDENEVNAKILLDIIKRTGLKLEDLLEAQSKNDFEM